MTQNKPTILVTGGAGYIGSHAVRALQGTEYQVVVLDNLVNGHLNTINNLSQVKVFIGDMGERKLLAQIFANHTIDAVVHFAAYAYVGESTVDPAKYYQNNVAKTLILLEEMVAASVKKLVFSSTCSTYGVPKTIPITEAHPQHPLNPYGNSKLMVEKILADFDIAYGLKSVCFRYFNAAGADPTGSTGEAHEPETHLIPLVLLTALGQRESIAIYGTDYPTPDQTCIRDYIHVIDLAQAHQLGLEYLLKGGSSEVFNLGNDQGFSVRQVIDIARRITNQTIKVVECDRRLGDAPILISSSEKAKKILGWQPQYPNLEDMILHAWHWHQQRHGYQKKLC